MRLGPRRHDEAALLLEQREESQIGFQAQNLPPLGQRSPLGSAVDLTNARECPTWVKLDRRLMNLPGHHHYR
jgi:hypothetical protein